MKITLLLVITSLFSNTSMADQHDKSTKAHTHGTLKIEMAVEEKTIDIEIDGPSEAFLGYEYAPKSTAEKKVWSNAEKMWTKDLLTKLFILDKSSGCEITEASFKQELDEHASHHSHHSKHTKDKKDKKESGVHSDIEATAKVTCTKEMAGQNMVVALKKHFPKINKLSVELVSTETKTIELNAKEQTIKL